MEEREVKKYYSEIEQSFLPENTKSTVDMANQMESTLRDIFTLVEGYEKIRADTVRNFQTELYSIIQEYWHGSYEDQINKINNLREEAHERWSEIKPRMEDLAQIKQLLRRFSGRRP